MNETELTPKCMRTDCQEMREKFKESNRRVIETNGFLYDVNQELEAERQWNVKLRYALDFYARHHHHLKTTAPNFALEVLGEEYTKERKADPEHPPLNKQEYGTEDEPRSPYDVIT